MEVTAALVEATEAQRQLDLTAKRQIGRPFLSSATGIKLSYVVDRLRMLEVAMVGGDLMTTQGAVAHTPEQGKAVLADFVAARKVIEDDAHTEKLALQADITLYHATLAELTPEKVDATTQEASATA